LKPLSKGEVAAAELVRAGLVSQLSIDILVDLITAGKFHVRVQIVVGQGTKPLEVSHKPIILNTLYYFFSILAA
jgi:hypothetical protein